MYSGVSVWENLQKIFWPPKKNLCLPQKTEILKMEFNLVRNRIREEVSKLTVMIDTFIEKNYTSGKISGDDAKGLYYMVMTRKILMDEVYEVEKGGKKK